MNRLSNDLLGEISRYLGSKDIQSVSVINRDCSIGIREAYKNPEFRKPIQERNRIIGNMKESIIFSYTISFMYVNLQDENYLDYIDIIFEIVCNYAVGSLVFVSEPKIVPTEIEWNKLLYHISHSKHNLESVVLQGLEVNEETYQMIKHMLHPIWNELGVKYISVSQDRVINDFEMNSVIDYFRIVDIQNNIE